MRSTNLTDSPRHQPYIESKEKEVPSISGPPDVPLMGLVSRTARDEENKMAVRYARQT